VVHDRFSNFLERSFRNVVSIGDVRNAYRILDGNREGRDHLRFMRRRWEDNIKICLKEKEYENVNWIHLAHDRDTWRALANKVINMWIA
jgi:hypothetical protein